MHVPSQKTDLGRLSDPLVRRDPGSHHAGSGADVKHFLHPDRLSHIFRTYQSFDAVLNNVYKLSLPLLVRDSDEGKWRA